MKLILSDRPLTLPELAEDTTYFDLSSMRINNCVGCFGCWVKTPGKCVIRDDAVQVYPYVAACDHVMYISRVKYGGYDTIMKTMLERCLPTQQAFLRVYNGETHHVQRNVVPKHATIIAYGDIDDEEKELFRRVVARNAHNMIFEDYRVLFVSEEELQATVESEVAAWAK